MRRPSAALAVARSELRRRGAALLVLGLVAGAAGATATGAAVLERRTATAYDRLDVATGLDDARILAPTAAAEIAKLPPVRSAWAPLSWVGQVRGPSVQFLSLTAGPPPPEGLFRPIVLAGRAPDPAAPHEVLIAEPLAQAAGFRPGSVLELALLTAAEVEQFDTGFGEPDGPRVTLTVTGIARLSSWGNGLGYALGTPAFAERYAATAAGSTVLVRLRDTPGARDELTAGLDRLNAAAGPATSDFGPLRATFPRLDVAPGIVAARRVLSLGVGSLAGVAGLAGLLVLAQALGRHHAVGAADQRVEAALGMTTGERVLARVLPALPAAALATVLAAAGGLAAGRLEPLGAMRRFEPSPGWRLDATVVVLGAAATGVLLLVLVATTAAVAGRVRRGTLARPAVRPLPLLLRRPATLAGAMLALDRGRGRGAVPVRAAVLGVALGVAGVVAAATFAVSLDRLISTPGRYGWTADFALVDAKEADLAALDRDARVAAVDVVGQSTVRTADGFAAAYSVAHRKGSLPWTVIRGRLPQRDTEVALGPGLAERLVTAPGGTARLAAAGGGERVFDVVGVVVAPPSETALSTAAVLTPGGLRAVGQSSPFVSAYIRAVPGERAALFAELSARHEMTAAAPPPEVATLGDLRRLPRVLAGFLAVLVVAALTHPLVLLVRRRRRDIGVLRAVGFTRRQVGAAVVVAALTTAVVGLAVGVPLGLAAGRVIWAELAASVGVAGDIAVPGAALLVLPGAVVLVALLVAALPARRAVRLPPAAAVRSE